MALSIVIVAASVWLALGEGDSADLAPLYLTIVVHNEEDVSRGVAPKASIPDYNGSPELMSHFADAMRAFAAMAADHRARINFGSDWTFSEGVRLYEPTFYIDLEALGHEVDAHAHQSSVLYREVREAVAAAGGNPTRVASGMEEATIQDQLEYFDHRAPEFEILWGVSLPGHGAGECTATWVWRPSRADWTLHDPDGRYVYVGHGELVNSLDAIRQAVDGRHPDRINTCAVFVSPREFKAAVGTEGIPDRWAAPTDSIHYWEQRIAWWDDFLSQIDVLVERGEVAYASLTEVVDVFRTEEHRLVFDWTEVPRSDAPMARRNRLAGYPLD